MGCLAATCRACFSEAHPPAPRTGRNRKKRGIGEACFSEGLGPGAGQPDSPSRGVDLAAGDGVTLVARRARFARIVPGGKGPWSDPDQSGIGIDPLCGGEIHWCPGPATVRGELTTVEVVNPSLAFKRGAEGDFATSVPFPKAPDLTSFSAAPWRGPWEEGRLGGTPF